MTDMNSNPVAFNVLDVRAIWIKEFASALSGQAPTVGWLPNISSVGYFRSAEWAETLPDPHLLVRHFPLQRGFARPAMWRLFREHVRIVDRLNRDCCKNSTSVIVCTSPAYAATAECWPGPVIYYVTDAFAFPGYTDDPEYVIRLDRKMCRRADMIFPNSQRIADYLISQAGCTEDKLLILPNATRSANLLSAPLLEPAKCPSDISDLRPPVACVIGNLAANMDWDLLNESIERTPWLSWVFVGPTDMPVLDEQQRYCRTQVMGREGRVRFVGYKAYGELSHYARAVDVAILPYRKCEPTFSGSSTRFYEHLAACRPIIATRGVEELLHKQPLLQLVDSAEHLADALNTLRQNGFRDGREHLRWETSREETWEARSDTMRRALSLRLAAKEGFSQRSRST